MSQAKVDRNKADKANRAQNMAKEKRERFLTKLCGVAILVALLGWAGVSAYDVYESKQPATYADLTVISDYVSSLSEAE